MNKFNGRLTLRNDFHGTTAAVIVKNGIISHSSLKRVRAKLCGMKDCSCGGIRGIQEMFFDYCYDRDGEYAKVYEKGGLCYEEM